MGSDHTTLLVDAGISGKRIEAGLNDIDLCSQDVSGILITHEHADHICGLGVMARRYGIPIYTTLGTKDAILRTPQVGKISEDLFHIINPDEGFRIGDLDISPFSIYHDAAQPVGYRVSYEEKSIAVATDMGHYDDYIVKNLQNLDAILIESNHDVNMLQVGRYPYYLKRRILGDRGHLSNELAGQLLCRILHDNIKNIQLGHLSHENNYEALAYETVCAEITMGDNPYKASDFQIQVAHRDRISDMVEV